MDSERGHPVRLSEHSERTTDAAVFGQIFRDGHFYALAPDTGIYIRPHETFSINNPGPSQIVMVSSQCPDPDRKPQFVTPLNVPSTDSASEGRAPLVRLVDRRAQSTADRWDRGLVDDEIGSTNATQFVGAIPPGPPPHHFYPYEKVVFILKRHSTMLSRRTTTPIPP